MACDNDCGTWRCVECLVDFYRPAPRPDSNAPVPRQGIEGHNPGCGKPAPYANPRPDAARVQEARRRQWD